MEKVQMIWIWYAACLFIVHLTFADQKEIVYPYTCDELDIIFVVDGSGSVGEKNFGTVKEWLNSSIVKIRRELGPPVQIGVLQFSSGNKYTIPFRLGSCSTESCMTRKLQKMDYLNRRTETYNALNRTLEVEFKRSPRSNTSRKLIVLVTDGHSDDTDEKLYSWYNESQRRNITTFAVGVGRYSLTQLQIIVNGGNSNESIFGVHDFNSLPVIVTKMTEKFCEDTDECALNVRVCSVNEDCSNTHGSYLCNCSNGYEKQDGKCQDKDECEDSPCGDKLCINTNGSYTCQCEEGYHDEDRRGCLDMNECARDLHNCSGNTVCVNTPGSYICNCTDGFEKDENDLCRTTGCEKGFLDEGNGVCSNCTCLPKIDLYGPLTSCDEDFNCAYEGGNGKTSCTVPTDHAFSAVFNAIQEWSKKANDMNNASQIIEKVMEINGKIKCAAAATRNITKFRANAKNIEALSTRVNTKPSSKSYIYNFSQSILESAEVANLETARMISVQFAAPKKSVDLILQQPDDDNSTSILKRNLVYTERSPIVAISLYNEENMEYRSDSKVSFEVDVGGDFQNASIESSVELDPVYWSGYVRDVQYQCMFIDTIAGNMSEHGCRAQQYVIGSKVICECDHTTMFAVMLTFNKVQIPRGVQIASYVTESLTVLCLIVTAIILLSVRPQIRGDRIGVQICLTFSLLFLHTFNLLNELAVMNDVTCEITAVIIHFFLLASGMWMLMEGVTLVIKTNNQTLKYFGEGNQKKLTALRHGLSWGIPFVFVLTSAAIGFTNDTYMHKSQLYVEEMARTDRWAIVHSKKYNFCWLSPTTLIWAVIVPMATIIVLNIIILIRMAIYIYGMSTQRDQFRPTVGGNTKHNHLKSTLKAVAVLLPVLGISWSIAFLTNTHQKHSSIVFMYINAILNGLQGVLIFIVYCIVGQEVRKAVKLKYQRQKSMHGSSRKSGNSRNGHQDSRDLEKPKENQGNKSPMNTKSFRIEDQNVIT